jgi:hypothetical protein
MTPFHVLLKTKLVEVLSQSTVHGVSNIVFYENLLVKLFWTVFLSLGAVFSFVLIYLTVNK